MVAIDSMMRPIPIPQFTPESDEEMADWDLAMEIRDHMVSKKKS